MKKFFLILGSIVVLLLLAMILIPYFYKDDILDLMKKEANKNLEAKVSFSNDIGLSLFQNFPNVTLTVKDIKVVNKKPFKGDTLAQVKQFRSTIDLMSLIRGDQMKIRGLHLDKPRLNVKVLPDGTANYNIMKTDTSAGKAEKQKTTDTGGGSFKLALKAYSVKKADLIYDDQSMGFYLNAKGFNHEGSGDFTTNIFNLDTKTTIEKLTLGYGGINYLDRVETLLDAKLKMNLKKMKFTFLENKLSLNAFALGFDGFLSMPGDKINMDLSFNAQKTGFKHLLSLVPAIYKKGYEDIQTKGSLDFQGEVNGTYSEGQYPAYKLHMSVDNGYFKYPDLPKSLKNVNLLLDVNCPDGKLDNTVTKLNKMHFEIGENPFDASMVFKTPISDPYVNGGMNGTVNIGHLQDLIPLGENTKLAGVLKSDLAVEGHYSSIEKEEYGKFEAKGKLSLSDFRYASPDLDQTVEIEESQMTLTPKKADLKKLSLKMGENDIYASGQVDNMLGYALKDKTLKGNLQVNSNYMNLNPMLASSESEKGGTKQEKEAKTTDTGGYQLEAPAVPDNIDFTLKADMMKRLIYDDMDMRNITGSIVIRDQAIFLKDFKMDMFEGSMMASGKYATKNPDQPETDFDLNIQKFGIQEAYETFTTVRKFAPIAAKAEGNFSGKLSFQSPLKKDLKPVYDQLYSKGKLKVKKAVISEHKILNRVATVLQDDAYKRVVLTDIQPSYIIKDGRIRLRKPIKFKIKDSKFKLTGSMKLDQTLDYNLRANVPSKMVKEKANQMLSQFTGQDFDIPGGDRVLMDFKITGKARDPKITPSFVGTEGDDEGGIKETLKKKGEEKLEEKKEALKEKGEEKAEEVKDKAKEKAKEKKKEAEEKAEKKKEEVKEKAKEKKEEAKDKAKDEAEDKVKDIFK